MCSQTQTGVIKPGSWEKREGTERTYRGRTKDRQAGRANRVCLYFHSNSTSAAAPDGHTSDSYSLFCLFQLRYLHCSVWEWCTINMWHMSLTCRGGDLWGSSVNHGPLPSLLTSSYLPSFILTLLILSCQGMRGPEESNNCDSGAFWHCSWGCADTHRDVCLL